MISTPAPVTSRAVREHVEDLRLHGDVQRGGRLVADQQVGVVGDGDRDDHALAFAAGQFVRERPGPPLRLGDADQFEQFDRARSRRAAGRRRAGARVMRLGDLVADGVDRGQRRHRVLEHRADRRCRGSATSRCRTGRAVRRRAAAPSRTPRRTRAAGRSTAIAVADLPEPDSPTSATTSPGSTSKLMPRTAATVLGVGGEGDAQVGHLEQARAHRFVALRRSALPAARVERVAQAVADRGWRTTRSAPARRPGTGTPTGTWSPTGCRRRSACPATRRVAARRSPGSSARFRPGSPPRRSARCR